MQAQRSIPTILALVLLLGCPAEGSRFMSELKPSGDAATDKADALAIKKLEAAAEQDAADAKQMNAVAGIEDAKAKTEDLDSQEEMQDGAAIEAVAETTAEDEEKQAQAELKDNKEDEKAAEKAATLEEEAHELDSLHLKEAATHEELDVLESQKDAARTRKDAARLGEKAEEELGAEKADVEALEKAAAEEAKEGAQKKKPSSTLAALKVGGRCGPQTKIHLPLTEDAASWSDPFAANKKHPIGRYDVKQAKICGPGTFTFSPTSCGRMDYKPDIFEVSPKERSSGCEVVDLEWCSIGGLGCMEVDC